MFKNEFDRGDQFIKEVKDHVFLYRDDKTGIAWIEDGTTGLRHSVHPNIATSGSIIGMKKCGYWNKKDVCAKSDGYIYNISKFVVDDELDNIVANECQCEECKKRRGE